MKRYVLTLDLKDDPRAIAEYKAHHRAVWPEVVGAKAETTYADWAAGARDVVAQGFKVLKTNLVQEPRDGGKPGFPTYLDGAIDRRTIDEAVTWIGTLRDVVGPSIGKDGADEPGRRRM